MHEYDTADGWGKLRFERDEAVISRKIPRPLAERILLRCPRLASMLTAVGAKSVPNNGRKGHGELAVMMAASGSIDVGGRQRRNYRFCTRPTS